jgi:hypothetical protein
MRLNLIFKGKLARHKCISMDSSVESLIINLKVSMVDLIELSVYSCRTGCLMLKRIEIWEN